jgi:NitT/TauT family transport system substrate-binding protein
MVLRSAAQAFGTLNWELDTIRHHRLDRSNGLPLEIFVVAAGSHWTGWRGRRSTISSEV